MDSRATLPDHLRHTYRIVLFENQVQQKQGQAVLDYIANLPQLAGQRFSLTFVPATATDEAALERLLPTGDLNFAQLPQRIPGYLLKLNAELRLGDEVMATAGSWSLGSQLFSELHYLPSTVLAGGNTYVPPHSASLTVPRLHEERTRTSILVGSTQIFAFALQGGLTPDLQALAT